MSAFALRNTIYSESSDNEFDDDEFEPEPFYTGEPICPPPRRRSRLSALLSCLAILGAAGGGWSLYNNPPAWFETISSDAERFEIVNVEVAESPLPDSAVAARFGG